MHFKYLKGDELMQKIAFFKLAATVLILSVFIISLTSCTTEKPNRPFNQIVAYTPGTIKPSASQSDLDKSVTSFYEKWKVHYLRVVPGSKPLQMYLHFNPEAADWVEPKNTVCRSEGQGYGMITVALMAGYDREAKKIFDAMFRFVKAHPSSINTNLMAWQQVLLPDGRIVTSENGQEETPSDSATDGDLDIAYALLLADTQWGSKGEINYSEEALKILHATLESVVNLDENILLLGDWVKAKQQEDKTGLYIITTRSSDFLLGHLKAFANYDLENKDRWLAIHHKMQEIIMDQYKKWSPKTGLIADFLIKNKDTGKYKPAKGYLLEDDYDGDYNWNACRIPWRYPIDYLVNGDTSILEQLSVLNSWIKKATDSNPLNIKPGYFISTGLEGQAIPDRNWQDMSFIAPFAVAAMIDKSNQEWLDAIWRLMTENENFSFENGYYFDNCIRMQVMLILTGHWWQPGR